MNEVIMNKLQEEYDKLIEDYGEDRILWVAATGQAIFDPDSIPEIPVSACYLPNEYNLYIVNPTLSFKDSRIIDIRYLKYVESDFILTPYKIINPKYEKILIDNLFLNSDIFIDDIALVNAVKNIIDSSFAVPAKEQELVNKLSKTEKIVLNNIIKDFNNSAEGDIIVSSKEKEYNISTAVFRTLFSKLKQYGVAEVDSRGVKGTHIKFNNLKTLQSLLINL